MTAIRSFPDAPLVRHTPPSLGVPLQAWARSVWDALHRVGQRRAAEHLLALAERRELTEPALSRELRAAADACRRAASSATP